MSCVFWCNTIIPCCLFHQIWMKISLKKKKNINQEQKQNSLSPYLSTCSNEHSLLILMRNYNQRYKELSLPIPEWDVWHVHHIWFTATAERWCDCYHCQGRRLWDSCHLFEWILVLIWIPERLWPLMFPRSQTKITDRLFLIIKQSIVM